MCFPEWAYFARAIPMLLRHCILVYGGIFALWHGFCIAFKGHFPEGNYVEDLHFSSWPVLQPVLISIGRQALYSFL
jgi:hypothetical protein